MFSIENEKTQNKLDERVSEAGIETSIDEKGRLRYATKNHKAVEGLAHRIMDESENYTRVTIHWPDPKYTELFIARLDSERIEYEIVHLDGYVSVSLKSENDSKWQPLESEINKLFYAEAARKIGFDAQ